MGGSIDMSRKDQVLGLFRRVFDKVDLDGDGSLSKEEVKSAMQKMADLQGEAATAEDINQAMEECFKELDANGDGQLSFEEVTDYVAKQAPPGQGLDDLDELPEEAWEAMNAMIVPMVDAMCE